MNTLLSQSLQVNLKLILKSLPTARASFLPKKPRPAKPPVLSLAAQPSREGELESSPRWAAATLSLFDLLGTLGAVGKGGRKGKELLRE